MLPQVTAFTQTHIFVVIQTNQVKGAYVCTYMYMYVLYNVIYMYVAMYIRTCTVCTEVRMYRINTHYPTDLTFNTHWCNVYTVRTCSHGDTV